jgi:hypothetical protein
MRESLRAYVAALGSASWVIAMEVLVAIFGLISEISGSSFPAWIWIALLLLAANAAPF